MTKLSDTQLVILSAAAQREDRNVLPLPGSGSWTVRSTRCGAWSRAPTAAKGVA